MRFRWFKMGIEGKVAVGNLALIGLTLIAFLVAFPGAVVDHDRTPRGMLTLASVLEVMFAVLSFPVGWLSILLTTSVSGPPFTAAIFVPLNAYLWGHTVAAVARWRRSRFRRASPPDDTSIRRGTIPAPVAPVAAAERTRQHDGNTSVDTGGPVHILKGRERFANRTAPMETDGKSWGSRHRRLIIGLPVAVFLVAAAVIVFMPWLVAPWSRLNNEEQELDLYSGRARFTRHFLYQRVSQEIQDTPLSEALAAVGGPDGGETWVKVNVFQPGYRTSPHFLYHGSLGQANHMAIVWEMYDCDPQARAKIARQFLQVLRDGGSYYVGDDYLRLLDKTIGPDPIAGRVPHVTTADAIPDDLAEQALAARAGQAGPR